MLPGLGRVWAPLGWTLEQSRYGRGQGGSGRTGEGGPVPGPAEVSRESPELEKNYSLLRYRVTLSTACPVPATGDSVPVARSGK